MSFQRTFLKTFATVGLFKYSGLVISFLLTMLVSRILSPDAYGIIASVAVISGFMSILIDAGLAAVIIRGPDDKGFQQTIAWMFVFLGITLLFLMLASAWPVSIFYGNRELIGVACLFGALLFAQSVSKPLESILSKHHKFRFIAFSNLVINLIQALLVLLLARLGFSYWSIIIPQIITQFLLLAWYRHKLSFHFGSFRLAELRETFLEQRKLIGNLLGFRALAYGTRNVDNIIVGKYYGTFSLGLYNRGFSVAALPVNLITGIMNEIQLPLYQKLAEKNEEEVSVQYESLLYLMGALGFPFVSILYLFPHTFSEFVWGHSWRSVGDYLKPLSILIPTNIILNSAGAMFIVKKAERFLLINSVVSALGILGGAIVGAMFSIKMMVVGLILGNLLFSVPITCYLGLYKSVQLNLKSIAQSWGVFWLFCLLLLFGYLLESRLFEVVLIIAYGIVSFWRVRKYYKRHLKI